MSLRTLFELPPAVTVPLRDDDRRFPVRRIYCVGRNYVEHIREMGGDEREPPFFFQKPTDAIVPPDAQVPYPPMTNDFQYEVELVLAIGKGGAFIPLPEAASHVCALGVGIDLTRRDVQIQARKTGRPWEIGKSFDASAPCSALTLLQTPTLPGQGRIELRVNGAVRQSGDLSQMIWSPGEIVSKLSEQYTLAPGDLIYTGTPAGVGPVQPGDHLLATIDGIGSLSIRITDGPRQR